MISGRHRLGQVFKRTNRGGRPTKLTDDLIERICEAIEVGNYFDVACASVGISRNTRLDWLKKGSDKPNSIYGRFSCAVLEAQANAEMMAVTRLNKLSTMSWQATAWTLQRRFPKRWGSTKAGNRTSDDDESDKKVFSYKYNLDDDDEDDLNEG